MTFSKTCQIDTFVLPINLKVLAEAMLGHVSMPVKTPIGMLPCAGKAKHSIVVKAGSLGAIGKGKFRFCDACFRLLCELHKDNPDAIGMALALEDDTPIVRFRRNRL